jgi:hypothetical protein
MIHYTYYYKLKLSNYNWWWLMAHLQKNIEEQYQDASKVFDMIKNARDVREVKEILNEFIKQNWRGMEFHSKVGEITTLISKECRGGRVGCMSGEYEAVPELARTLSEFNDGLRRRIDKGGSKPGMERMTADRYEKDDIEARKKQPKNYEEFAKEELLDEDGHLYDELKVKDAILKLRQGRLTPSNTKKVMEKLMASYTLSAGDVSRLEGVMVSINANLASEYHELRGKLESQKSFRNVNLA